MVYVGFWRRAAALAVDVALVAPVAFVFGRTLNERNAAFLIPAYTSAVALYFPYFHASWGQTPGKRMLGLRVVNPDGSPIGWTQAHLRSIAGYLGAFACGVGWFAAIHSMPPNALAATPHRMALINAAAPGWYSDVKILMSAWALGDVGAMLRSREKRSLHDLIGGTVVVSCKRPVPPREGQGPASSEEEGA